MSRGRNHRKISSFTLVEVLLAVGIFAVAAIAMIALFPMAMQTDKGSAEETRSTLIAGSIMDALSLGHDPEGVSVAQGMTNGVPIWKVLHPQGGVTIALSYDASCEPLRQLDAAEAEKPVGDPKAVAVAVLKLTPRHSTPGLITAEVTVEAPASAPAARRTLHHFVRLLALP